MVLLFQSGVERMCREAADELERMAQAEKDRMRYGDGDKE